MLILFDCDIWKNINTGAKAPGLETAAAMKGLSGWCKVLSNIKNKCNQATRYLFTTLSGPTLHLLWLHQLKGMDAFFSPYLKHFIKYNKWAKIDRSEGWNQKTLDKVFISLKRSDTTELVDLGGWYSPVAISSGVEGADTTLGDVVSSG